MSQSATPSRLDRPLTAHARSGPADLQDANLVGAEFVREAPAQFNDAQRSDRRNPAPDSFDVLAPDGYLHAMPLPVGESGLQWEIAVVAPHTTLAELLMGALSEIGHRGGGLVTWWRAGATPQDDRTAARLGFVRDREQQQLRVALPISFDPHHTDDVRITSFSTASDADDWLIANNAAFAGHHEQSGWDRALLDDRLAQPWFDRELFLVARDTEDGPIVAFNWMKVHEADPNIGEPRLGEIYAIGVIPEAQGRGLGYALAGLGLRALHVRGISTAMLYVAADNAPALALYRRLGFSMHRTDAAYCTSVTPL